MSVLTQAKPIVYPDSDGQPMADNTVQFRYIVMIQGGLDAVFADETNVFVAGDLLWYPVEGEPTIRQAPDVMVAFGRPKGHRGSYRQWEEDGIAPQAVFEILSPGNRAAEMVRKFAFYERYGVEEYYIFDPDEGDLTGWLRDGEALKEIPNMRGWVSPRLGVRFEVHNDELHLFGPDGRRFLSFVELAQERARAERQRDEQAKAAEALRAQLIALGVEPQA
jgi:Uma2 family endonuclease